MSSGDKQKKAGVFALVAVIVMALDQWSKYVIRNTPDLHNYTIIEGWLMFRYTQNPGMAMGIQWADTFVISLVAIAATIAIILYTVKIMDRTNMGFIVCIGLIIGGALGNIADRIFMARIGGYGGILDGHVVDFIFFKYKWGDSEIFPYIFNVADVAISVAIITLIVFGKWLLPEDEPKPKEDADPELNQDEEVLTEEKTDSENGLSEEPDPDAGEKKKSDGDSEPVKKPEE